jgi:hypothetical protein
MAILRNDITVFNKRLANGYIAHAISQQSIDNINSIASKVTSSSYERTPQFKRGGGHVGDTGRSGWTGNGASSNRRPPPKKRVAPVQEMSDQDWELLRKFESTKLAAREGIDRSVDTINGLLNKLSDATYDAILADVSNELTSIRAADTDATNSADIARVADAIFKLASRNRFYTELYSKISAALLLKFPYMVDVFKTKFSDTQKIISDIEWCSADEDYDKFCANNKKNEERRALCSFYAHLYKWNIITGDDLVQTIASFQSELMSGLDDKQNRAKNEEISENILLLVCDTFQSIMDHADMGEIINNVTSISNMSAKVRVGINNKIIFKHMDMVELFGK